MIMIFGVIHADISYENHMKLHPSKHYRTLRRRPNIGPMCRVCWSRPSLHVYNWALVKYCTVPTN